jgi:cell division protein FtsQ
MPLEMDPEDDDAPRPRRRYDKPAGKWYRPAGTAGRIFLALGVAVILTAFITGFVLLERFLEHDARFRIAGVSSIQAIGLNEVSRSEILPVFGADIGKNIFFIHLGERRRQLEQIPWIEHATVMRLLPDQLRITVVERTPIAFARQGQQIGLVDASGVLLSMPPAMMTKHHYSFPVVTGIDPRDPINSRRARMAVYQRLIADLDSNGQHLSEQISEIDLTDPEDARVLMPEQGGDILAHFGDDQFLERYQRYKAHIAEWRQQYPKLAAVDLRYEQQVVLQMAAGSGVSQAAVNTAPASSAPSDNASAPNKPSAAVKSTEAPEDSATQAKPPAKPAHTPHAATKPPAKMTAQQKHAADMRAALQRAKASRAANARTQ